MRRSNIKGKKSRAISEMLAALIIIAIVAFAGIMLFFMTGSFFRGGGRASLTISATGSGSSDGTRATINLVIQNTGDGAARISAIYVAPETQNVGVNVNSVTGAVAGNVTLSTLAAGSMPQTGSFPASGFDIDTKSSRTVFLQVAGTGLYAGAQLRIYVVYWDIGSRQPSIVDTVVTLR